MTEMKTNAVPQVKAKRAVRRADRIVTWIVGIVGVGLVFYPLFSNLYFSITGYLATQRYEEVVAQATQVERERADAYIAEYNAQVARQSSGQSLVFEEGAPPPSVVEVGEPRTKRPGVQARPPAPPTVTKEKLLGAMVGVLEIPTLDQEIPIHAGTSAYTLSRAVGLVNGTSIPTTGAGVHSVIAGHRGLVHAEFFRHLDRLQVGHLFYIAVGDQTYAYQVDRIEVVTPDVAADFQLDEGKNYVSLMTCTPYMVNSHRLLVRGEQVPLPTDPLEGLPNWAIPLATLLGALLALLILLMVVLRRGSARFLDLGLSDAQGDAGSSGADASSEQVRPVSGATFALYCFNPQHLTPAKASSTRLTTSVSGQNRLVQAKVVADEEGLVAVRKLKRGHYYFIQTGVPDTWSLNPRPMVLRIRLGRLHWGHRRAQTFHNHPAEP
jgi:LPXTG-site transpeptidase (sortase) family protein